MIVKKFPILFSLSMKKMRYAYGVCSRVPNMDGKHYLLFDCDNDFDWNYFLHRYKAPMATYLSRSQKGSHVIVFLPLPFYEAVSEVLKCPFVDRNHVSFAVKRGYFFLETTVPLFFSKITYMRIERT